MPPCSPKDETTKRGGKAPQEPSLKHASSSASQPEPPQGPFLPCSQLSQEVWEGSVLQDGSPAPLQLGPPRLHSSPPWLRLSPRTTHPLGQALAVHPRHKKIRPSELPASEQGNLLTGLFTVGAEATLNAEPWSQLARLVSAGALRKQHPEGNEPLFCASGPAPL